MKQYSLTQDHITLLRNSDHEKRTEIISKLGLDPKKGILLTGKTGVGKTYSIEFLVGLLSYSGVNLMTANQIVQQYIRFHRDAQTRHPLDYRMSYDLIVDDLGSEMSKIQIYGTELQPLTDLITERYANPNLKTHITTNLSMDGIASRYGDRVWSRLWQMCNVIELTGKDYRLG